MTTERAQKLTSLRRSGGGRPAGEWSPAYLVPPPDAHEFPNKAWAYCDEDGGVAAGYTSRTGNKIYYNLIYSFICRKTSLNKKNLRKVKHQLIKYLLPWKTDM
jgi:hypothetical protein